MTLAIILIVAAALALIFIIRITVSQKLQISPSDLATQIQPIDIDAFRNLLNPAEDEYLRRRLPPAQFRTVQRERLRAMAAYIHTAGQNAAVLVRLGQNALAATDVNTAEAAHQLVQNALLLRRNCAFALLRIYLALAWPNGSPAAAFILHRYEQLNGSAMLLGRLQNPAAPLRISAGL
jgi:hypothetical protein